MRFNNLRELIDDSVWDEITEYTDGCIFVTCVFEYEDKHYMTEYKETMDGIEMITDEADECEQIVQETKVWIEKSEKSEYRKMLDGEPSSFTIVNETPITMTCNSVIVEIQYDTPEGLQVALVERVFENGEWRYV